MKASFIAKVLVFMTALFFAAPLQAGTMSVTPDAAVTASTGNDFDFLYTAAQAMGDGTVVLTMPNPWPDPVSGNVSVTVINGVTGTTLNALDADPPTGWTGNVSGFCIGCGVTLDTDTTEFFSGTGSLRADIALSVGLGASARVFYDFGAGQQKNWSGYTHLSFYMRKEALLNISLLSGSSLLISENASLASPTTYSLTSLIQDIDVLNLLNAGDWVQIVVDLTSAAGTTRDSVRTFGFVFPSLASAGVNQSVFFDQIMVGPTPAVFSGDTVRQNLMSLDSGGTVRFHYHGVTAPAALGTYNFLTQERADSSATLASILSPDIEIVSDVETNCSDGLDDNLDLLIDCLDPDCSGAPACQGVESDCTNGTDDDADTQIDCLDADCALHPACNPETDCTDGVDDDLDLFIDCLDSDCSGDPACQNVETNCTDGLDGDNDTAVDCLDTDCALYPSCHPETDCDDGIDEDLDGDTDCGDSDCANDAACLPEDPPPPDDTDDGDDDETNTDDRTNNDSPADNPTDPSAGGTNTVGEQGGLTGSGGCSLIPGLF